MKFDVAIVGAGPAGSTLAAILARRGLGVALIDRDQFPRDKLCGEFLSYDALPILDRLGVALKTPQIASCRVISRHRQYEFEFPSAARGVSRQLLDDLLFRTAVRSGAHPFAGWTASDLFPLSIERGGERQLIDARLIVGAWGRWGRFDTQLGRGFAKDRSHRHFGFKRHYVERQPSSAAGVIELYSYRGGYLGVSPIENRITNICGLVHASRLAGHKGRWQTFVDEIRSEEPRLDAMYARHEPAQDGFLSSEPVIFRARSPVERGVPMIGDASGIVDPLTGNGMAMAIQSAAVAVPHVMGMLGGRGNENAYRDAHARFFGPRIAWSRRVAAILSRPSLLDAALRAVRSRRPGEFLLAHTRATPAAVERLADESF
ncbi:MAG TPA: NAD(P)/FAD-dependent oxidoreductase [Thermoanaerobaculia bacterium]|nr:NAD(P)/FAD-dependent oxidoreductase [Thermoanaerobaculia bacterium]